MNSLYPDVSFGGLPFLQAGGTTRTFLKFDLTGLSPTLNPSDVSRASLVLWVGRVATAGEVQVSEAAGPWDEATLTYTSAPASGAFIVPFSVSQASQFVTLDVTATVQKWLQSPQSNHGFVLSGAPQGPAAVVFFDSKESVSTSHAPELNVSFRAGVGPAGITGPRGDAGADGAPGAASTVPGPAGLAGATGPVGSGGPAGAVGPTGAASTVPGPGGLAGATGPTGAASNVPGPVGPGGSAGAVGATGAASNVPGPAGAAGATGPTGAASIVPGPIGPGGPAGAVGATGAASNVPGPAGAAGATGPTGAASIVPGPAGAAGATGPTGAASIVPGPSGAAGPIGATGATGPAGTSGLSQYGYIYNTGAQVVAIGASVIFDSNGILTAGVTHTAGTSQIALTSTGNYKVNFSISGVEPSQFTLFLNDVAIAGTTYGSGAGTQQNNGQALTAMFAGDVLTLRNNASAAAVTLQTLAGGTVANANASIVIEKLN